MTRPPRRIAAATLLLVVVGLAGSGGCAEDKSFALVSVVSTGAPFNDVAQLLVDLENGTNTDFLKYPQMRTAAVRFDQQTALTFSVSFKTSYQGTLKVGVTPVNTGGVELGYGTGTAVILVGKVTQVTVQVERGASPPVRRDGGAGATDGGAGGGDGASRLEGGAGLTPDAATMCEPSMPTACTGGGTCFVECRPDGGAGGICTAGGTRKPGEVCARNEDCTPGSQCFSFACGGAQMVRTCLRFCTKDDECGGGRCNVEIPCGDRATGFKACSRPCDPVGEATSGCAAGLRCFVFANEVPDCDCRSATQIGGDGARCTDGSDCGPGFLCVSMGGERMCRAVCRLDNPLCPAGTTCTKLVMPDFNVYGGCLP